MKVKHELFSTQYIIQDPNGWGFFFKKGKESAKLYEFYDFSPLVFSLIRGFYCLSDDDYLKAVGPESVIGELLMGNFMCLTE